MEEPSCTNSVTIPIDLDSLQSPYRVFQVKRLPLDIKIEDIASVANFSPTPDLSSNIHFFLTLEVKSDEMPTTVFIHLSTGCSSGMRNYL
ncbi:hypothetical protein Moror_15473 [Moniliophthora roreri MCA 2997]|uniref:Uncharacterized protein n=1 Tax=Moniliophthora roreri (strain MCA 2997) TaxID=1381753 RepID=V2W660_MONRO|nr:hypothetical protein Moror_15473 [Moniliophthora roreri MCA 2997]